MGVKLLVLISMMLMMGVISHGAGKILKLTNNSGGGTYLTQDEKWFSQTLDHYSPTDHRQFNQRYYEFLDYFQKPDGPIFLKLCGESSCNGIVNDYITILAKKFGAAVVSLEHRYYGKSSPFKDLKTDNLRYLSSKQALFDLAAFRNYYQEVMNRKQNVSSYENSWFVFGVSYSGALSAWFRLKFPHLTCGSLASSAVVLTVYNFTDFDKQIGESAGPDCKRALQEVTRLAEEGLSNNAKAVKSLFGAEKLRNDGDFLYMLADAAVVAFQYGNPDALCSPLIEANASRNNLLDVYADYVKNYFFGSFGASIETYDQEILKKTTFNGKNSDRLWWYQVCTEVAYFQVAPSNDSIRSSKVDTKYHLDLCKNVFGKGIYPDVDTTNLYYGGTSIAGSKIIFTNGSQDPWRHASKQKSSKDMPSYLIKCHNCGHGTDLRGCPQSPLSLEGDASKCGSPDAVQKVRQEMIEHIDLWLSECDDQGRSFFM
uniref:Serine carboxypeptidase S28 family protein n=1 Tax=Araucaria cunninghamii TaxID=56994 RepID=A0A0D6R0X7_ARACU